MNIRNVLRTYSLLRQLTDDESALLETLRSMNEAERELLVEALAPQKSTTKRAGKKSSKSPSKSSRASGIEATLKKSLEQQRRVTKLDDEERCTVLRGDGEVCELLADHNIHHLQTDPLYHEFDVGKPPASPAPRAGAKSSTNGGEKSSILNSVDETVSAGAVAGGSNE